MDKTTEKLLLKSTSIIHTEDESGNSEQATCFFIKRTGKGAEHHYLVTNKHVLEGKTKIHLYLDQYHKNSNTYTYNKKVTMTLNNAVKFHSTCDLAILNIDNIAKHNTENDIYHYSPLDTGMIPDNFEKFSHFQRIFMLGYPSGIHDTTSNLPVARGGVISTPLTNHYKGKAEFLIDIPFLNGCSGSPVFAKKNGSIYLVGIEYSKLLEKVIVDKQKNRLYRSSKYTIEVETGLGIAIRADQLLELF